MTKPAEKRTDEDTKMQMMFLKNNVEERKDNDTTEQRNVLKKFAYVQAEDREYYDTMIQS